MRSGANDREDTLTDAVELLDKLRSVLVNEEESDHDEEHREQQIQRSAAGCEDPARDVPDVLAAQELDDFA